MPRRARAEKDKAPGDTYDLSGDFRHATINIQSTIVGAAEVRDIETLPAEPGDPPYLGLQAFREQNADQFFGRELLTAKLVNRLAGTHFLALIGASGSGKSSLVRAGVIPALRRGLRLTDGSVPPPGSGQWWMVTLTPSAHPLLALAAALAPDNSPAQVPTDAATASADAQPAAADTQPLSAATNAASADESAAADMTAALRKAPPTGQTTQAAADAQTADAGAATPTIGAGTTSAGGQIADISALAQTLQSQPGALGLAARRALAQAQRETLLLVIDAFEEVFTQCRDEAERAAFIAALLAVSDPADPQPVRVLMVLRADFYANLGPYDALRERVAGQQEFIGAMNRDELFRAIVQPAALGNWKIQQGLAEVMLDDIGDEPGALPLLSHALLETWNRRRGRTLTLSGYQESGGVRGAIAQTAEAVFRQRLTPAQQAVARQIFLRLVDIEDDARDTRRRATYSEMITRAADPLTINAVLSILSDARLVTTSTVEPGDVQVVEVAHEALIREWPTLREWLTENRAGLITQRQLCEHAQDWLRLQRDPGALYRGTRLEQAAQWAAQNGDSISLEEQEFLHASQQAAQAEAERDHQLQRTRLLRRWIYPALGVVMLGILAVLFYASGFYIRFLTPARMSGILNVAVAEFDQTGADGTPASSPAGGLLSGWVTNKLRAELGGDPNLLVWQDGADLRRQNVSIGRVAGQTPAERAQSAAALAERLNAQMVVFGRVDARNVPAQLVLEFWFAPQAGYNFADLQGPYQVSTPITLLDPAHPGVDVQPEIDRQASTLAWLALGLTRQHFGQSQQALQAFRKAEQFAPDAAAVQFFIGRESLFLADSDAPNTERWTQQAETAFRQALQLDSTYARAWVGLGSVENAQAQRLVSAAAADLAPAQAAVQLAPALALTTRACDDYRAVLNLPVSAKTAGVPVDETAHLGLGTCLRLRGEIEQRSGQPSAAATLTQAAQELEGVIQPFKADHQDRYLAQTYETLGTAYQWLGYIGEVDSHAQDAAAHYQRAAGYYDQCIAVGKTSADHIIQSDLVARRCAPFRQAVQQRLDALAGGS